MSVPPLPDDVRRLLRECITDFDCLEIVLLLFQSSGEHWTAEGVAQRTGLALDATRAALKGLVDGGLLRRSGEGLPESFRFAPQQEHLATAVVSLSHLIQTQRPAIMSLMNANAIERVRSGAARTFADAFLIRNRRREDG